ncbi:Ubiquitin_protein [Hexamita inflata]|uniref:Putative n=1 Tax=Hexamita inflata TaxID=28002 RepID=A0AA86PZ64_9EUKA|nr:Ubiquitin protein [Hexamita inflata]
MKLVLKVLKTGETFDVEAQPSDLGKVLVDMAAEKLKTPADQIRLICAQQILKDQKTLEENRITEGQVIQVTIRKVQSIQTQETKLPEVKSAPVAPQAPAQQHGANPMDMMNNPDFMRQMMNNPIAKQMFNNPEFIKQQMTNNPIMQDLAKKNPELAEALEDPEVMKQLADVMSDPVKYEELLRQQDQMMANLQNVPGGPEMLQKLQADLADVTATHMGQPQQAQDWFLPEQQKKAGQNIPKKEPEDADPLPKSYLQSINQQKKPLQTTPSMPPMPKLQEQMQQMGMPSQMGGVDMQQAMEMMNDPMVAQFLDTIIDDPAQFAAYMSNPMVQQQIQQMSAGNPMVSSLMSNPEQYRQMLKQARQMSKTGGFGGQQQFRGPAQQQPRQQQVTQQQAAQQGAAQQAMMQQLSTKWAQELEMIKSMGIVASDEEILQLLEVCNGNVEMVINQLFEGM